MPTVARPLSAVLLVLTLALAGCGLFSKDPAVLNGVVLSAASNQPVAEAVVQIRVPGADRVVQELRTDADGAFSFSVDVDSVASFRIVGFKPGEFEASDMMITVEAEQTLTLPALRLNPSVGDTRPATISGFVLADADGAGLANATVRVEDVERRRVLRTGTTNAEGYYEIALSLAQSQTLRISAQRDGFEADFVDAAIAASEVNQVEDLRLRSAGPGLLRGTVVDATTDQPLGNADVQIRDVDRQLILQEVQTNASGAFEATLALSEPRLIEVRVARTGYAGAQQTVTLDAGQTVVVPDFRLTPGTAEARSITLHSRTGQAIGVSGSGTTETATLTFVVLDGSGQPINAASAVPVRFEMIHRPSPSGAPNAEFIYPAETTTDADGRASVTLTSGIRAGVVQVRAEFTGASGPIRSQPVIIAIHGGLPDQAHFSVVPQRRNLHACVEYGIENLITVFAGDQYANPVQANTAIYLTTNGGIVQGSGFTDALGRVSVPLLAANPMPPDYLATVTARTAGVDGVQVTGSTLVRFSCATTVFVEFTGGTLVQGGTLSYRLFVRDVNGHPLVGGSTASVSVQGENVEALGQTSITIPDALYGGAGVTEFSFGVRSTAEPETDEDGNVTWPPARLDGIRVNVSSPNSPGGGGEYSCFGSACPGAGQRGPVRLQRDERL